MAIIDIPSLAAAVAVADADLVAVTQGTAVPKKQTFTAIWNWLLGKGLPTRVTKTAAQTKTSDTTLAADSVLKFAMAANTKYAIEGVIFWDTGVTEDFKFDFNGPASPSLVRIAHYGIPPTATVIVNIGVDTAYNVVTFMNGAGANGGAMWFSGIVHNGATAGDFEFRWAQNTSGATATTLLAGSHLQYRVI